MQVNIKRIDPSLPLPTYQTTGAACVDLLARETTIIAPHQIGLIPCNIIVETPPGYFFAVLPRSSTPKKKGLLIPHGMGVIDSDYAGPEDEVKFQVLNFTDNEVTIEKGERVAQGCFIKIAQVEFVELKKVTKKTRGGFGSTG